MVFRPGMHGNGPYGSRRPPARRLRNPWKSPETLGPRAQYVSPRAAMGTALSTAVSFGGAVVQGRFDSRDPGAQMTLYTPAHASGSVDVVVSGQSGESVLLTDAFTYASPETFNFNGDWSGWGDNGQDRPILFTIQNNLLLAATCETFDDLTSRGDHDCDILPAASRDQQRVLVCRRQRRCLFRPDCLAFPSHGDHSAWTL